MRFVAFAMLASIVTACIPTPPEPPAPRTAMDVNAPFAKTWEAAIDVFAERNISIKTLDRASGLIVAEPVKVGAGGTEFADCGTDAMQVRQYPTDATWNLVVRGDSTKSTVRANVRFIRIGMSRAALSTATVTEECSTRGVWETDFETRLKVTAEAKK